MRFHCLLRPFFKFASGRARSGPLGLYSLSEAVSLSLTTAATLSGSARRREVAQEHAGWHRPHGFCTAP